MREFIERLRKDGLLTEVREPVSPNLEAPRIAYRTKGPVLFDDVNGSKVVMNLLGTRDALANAIGVQRDEIIQFLTSRSRGTTESMPRPEFDYDGPADLDRLPVMNHFPGDGGPYITGGVVVAEYDGTTNASIHRLMLLNKKKVAARLVPPRHTYLMHKKAAENGDKLPVAIAIGLDPVVTYATCTRVPEGAEFNYASALKGRPIGLWECENGVRVPDAEIVIEGYISPDERVKEGPFVDITGTYDDVRMEPVIELTRMYVKEDAVYHGIMPASGEHHLLMGVPYEPLIFQSVNKVTRAKNVVLTEGGCCYLHAVVQIEKQTEGDAKNAIMAAFAAHTSLKHVVVVDEDVDIFDPSAVEYAIATRMRGDRDVLMVTGVRGSSLDPMCEDDGTTTKVGVDATMPLEERERFMRVNPF